MVRPAPPRDPWRNAPVGELQEQLLPRWFVILVLVTVPVAIAAVVAAFVVYDGGQVPVAERRPPPDEQHTHAVGDMAVGPSQPQPYDPACPQLDGLRIAGEDADLAVLSTGLDALCVAELDDATRERLAAFAVAGGVVRFAVFETTGVDSTADLDGERVLLNAKFSHARPEWIAPLVAHDVTLLAMDPARTKSALQARRVEHALCTELFTDVFADVPASRGCADAEALLALDEPLEALQAAGYRP